MDSNLGRAGYRIGTYVSLLAGLLVWFTEPDTAERAISWLTLIMGLLFLLLITVIVRIGQRD